MTTHIHQKEGSARPSQAKPLVLHSVPMWLEGALDPTLTLEQKGMMLAACGARYAQMFQERPEVAEILKNLEIDPNSLPASDAQLPNYFDLSPEDWPKRIWTPFRVDLMSWATGMTNRFAKEKTPSKPPVPTPSGEKPHVRL